MNKYWFLFVLSVIVACNKTDEDIPLPNENVSLEPSSSGEIIRHTYYSLAYSEKHEHALWVYYTLNQENINGGHERTDDFRADPLVSSGSASLEDYKYSGYDRGHLCPAADMTQSYKAMSETFYLSNMSPQVAGFNRGIWSSLEDQVREWALQYKKLYVATGPVFKENLGTVGINGVTVPGYYYKVVYDGNKKMVAFILKNESSSNNLDQFVKTVDFIELQTGIDFFPGLPDELENQLEGSIATGLNFD